MIFWYFPLSKSVSLIFKCTFYSFTVKTPVLRSKVATYNIRKSFWFSETKFGRFTFKSFLKNSLIKFTNIKILDLHILFLKTNL